MKYKVNIPYWDSGVRRKFEIEFIIEANSKQEALERAKKKFDSYEKNNFASWVRIMYENEIKIEEVKE